MADTSKAGAPKRTTKRTARASTATKAPTGKAAAAGEDGGGAITIKKYANRRLYNTATSSYVTLDHLCQMVKDGVDFVVYDAKTGEDITRSVLTQIIVEEESKGQNLLPIGFLRQLISFYGDNLQMVVPGYLESSMTAFAQNQERMRSYMQEAFGGMYPFGSIEDMTKRNLAMLEQAMTMFTPPGSGAGPSGAEDKTVPGNGADPGGAGGDETAVAVKQLQNQLEILQRQLIELGTGTASKRDSKPD